MTPEAINQAMAELDEWNPTADGGICWDLEGTPIIGYFPYTADLNAVARVVGKLAPLVLFDYRETLFGICECCEHITFDATAAQRCEAILRACGKWVDQ